AVDSLLHAAQATTQKRKPSSVSLLMTRHLHQKGTTTHITSGSSLRPALARLPSAEVSFSRSARCLRDRGRRRERRTTSSGSPRGRSKERARPPASPRRR